MKETGKKGIKTGASYLCLLLITFLVPLIIYRGTSNYVLIKLSVTQTLLLIGLLLWMGKILWSGGGLELFKVPLSLPIIIFFFLSLTSILVSEYPWTGPPEIYRLATYFLLYGFTVNIVRNRRRLSGIVFVWLLSTGIVSIYGLYQYVSKEVLPPRSTFGNANFFAAYLVLVFPLALALFMHGIFSGSKKKNRAGILFLAILLVAMSFSIYQASSRGAWLGLAVGLVSLGWLRCLEVKPRWIATRIIPAFLVLILMLTAVLTPRLLEKKFAREELEKGTLGLRILIWEGTVRMVAARPLLGWGAGSFRVAYPPYRLPEYFRNPHAVDATAHAHNEFLEVAAETGIPGLVAFLWILIAFLDKGIDIVKKSEDRYERVLTMGLISGIVGLLATNLAGVNLRFPSSAVFLWLAMGLVMSQSPLTGYKLLVINYRLRVLKGIASTLILGGVIWIGWQVVVKPFEAEKHFKQGINYRKWGDWNKAISEYNRATEIAPYFIEVYYRLGFAYARNGDLDAAISAYNRVKKLAPDYARVHNNLAVLYLKKGDLDMAIKSLERALKLNPYDIEAHKVLSNLYSRKGEWDKARAEYSKALALTGD